MMIADLGVWFLVSLAVMKPIFRVRQWRQSGIMAKLLLLGAANFTFYAGIMGWHYVFESGPLWCLLVAGVTVGLWQVARRVGRPGLALAWTGLLLVSPMTSYQSFDPVWSPSRIGLAVGEVGFARKQHEEFRNRVRQRVKEDRALVLVDPDPADRHIDFVVNEPTLDAAVLVGRYVPKLVPLSEVLRTFPERRVFVYDARTGRLREVRR